MHIIRVNESEYNAIHFLSKETASDWTVKRNMAKLYKTVQSIPIHSNQSVCTIYLNFPNLTRTLLTKGEAVRFFEAKYLILGQKLINETEQYDLYATLFKKAQKQ